ncbi:MAG: TRAP transporter substrate-binding protein DctP [Burkholderiaceae bacterium]
MNILSTRRNALATLVAATVALAALTPAQAADHTMRISHQFPPTHHSARNIDQFAKDVADATRGKVEVQIFGAAQLYKPNQHHAAVASGKIEAAMVLNFQWGGNIPEMSATIIPYLITSVEKQKAFVNGSEAAKFLDAKLEAKGVKNIAWIVDTNDGIFTSNPRPLIKPEDFQGVKIRGLNKMFDAGLIAMGATPVSMPGSETYQALQTGVIDAGFTGVKAANSRKFYEIQKYGVASNIILAFDNLIVNPAWWNGLPADIRTAVQGAADAAVQRSIRTENGVPPEDVAVLNEKGMTAVALTKAQEDVMAAAMQPAVKKTFVEQAGADGEKLLMLLDKL